MTIAENIVETLAALSSAEEFFAALDVPFDPKVLSVHRLHILARFRENLTSLGDEPDRPAARAALARAYAATVGGSSPPFAVFRKSEHPESLGFVPLSAIG